MLRFGSAKQVLPSDIGEYFESHFITAAVVVFIFIFILLLKNLFFIYCRFFFSETKFTYLLTLLTYCCMLYKSWHLLQHWQYFSKKVEVIFGDLLLSKNKPISVGIVHGPSKDRNILQLFVEVPNLLNILEYEIFVLGEMNINIF